ncbi:MAG: hypothetical protein AB7F89_19255 [Pirellulaceae bacterium]
MANCSLRILSRPPTESERAAARDLFQSLPAEHERLTARLAQRESEWAPEQLQRERLQEQSVAAAESDLTAYEQQIAAREVELDKQHQDQLRQREQELRHAEDSLPMRLAN